MAQNDILQTSCLHIVIFFHSPVFILIQCSRTPKIFLGSRNLLGGDPRQISIFIILSILKNFNDIALASYPYGGTLLPWAIMVNTWSV